MQNHSFEENRRKHIMVMIALIVIPFLLAAFLWWILPSGYAAKLAKKQSVACQINFWHPLQPAIKLGAEILTP